MLGNVEGLLLREHSHRVANDMAVACAALRFAERRVGTDQAITTVIARLDAAAQVQRLLCAQPTGTAVDLVGVLGRLCDAMLIAHPGRPSAVELSGDPLLVADADAWVLFMCVHELVGNALRHGGQRGARVRVVVADGAGSTTVTVVDRGGPREWSRPGGQGAAIVDDLAATLGGRVLRSSGTGGGRVEIATPTLATVPIATCVGA